MITVDGQLDSNRKRPGTPEKRRNHELPIMPAAPIADTQEPERPPERLNIFKFHISNFGFGRFEIFKKGVDPLIIRF